MAGNMGPHCYCSVADREDDMLDCERCKRGFHIGCLKSPLPSPLQGDTLFLLTCSYCSDTGQEAAVRMRISWLQAISLALYNLHLTSTGKCGYYRWKEQICGFIEKHWSLLFADTRKQSSTWFGTVSSVLSSGSNDHFKSGTDELKELGWWRLREIKPPTRDMDVKIKSARAARKKMNEDQKASMDSLRARTKKSIMETAIDIKEKRSNSQESTPQTTVASSESVSLSSSQNSDDVLDSGSKPSAAALLSQKLQAENNEEITKKLFTEKDLVATEQVPDLLLADDLSGESDFEVDPCAVSPEGSPLTLHKNPEMDDIMRSLGSSSDQRMGISDSSQHTQSSQKAEDSGLSSPEESEGEDDDEGPASKKRKQDEKPQIKSEPESHKIFEPLSLYEEKQLLKKLNDLSKLVPFDPEAARLRRKLIVRQAQREHGQPVFDLDAEVSGLTGAVVRRAYRPDYTDYTQHNPNNLPTTMEGLDTHRVLDRYQCSMNSLKFVTQQPVSFLNRLVGFEDGQLQNIVSPYTARILKPFIRRDYESRPLKMKLLNEIVAYHNRKDPLWRPCQMPPIDYCYVRPQHIPSINSLCKEFFWPGIDLSDCLQYPEFSCVVLYRKFVIGFAFMVPDVKYNEAYISFLFTHPEWRRAGIAKFMLYHLIQTCMGKDVTLHVSATNTAMMLYQKFGFKPEEFILDFYEKYYPLDSKECRHAFFMRLRR
ncbi:cysteine-rich protein 2-binding protein-like isoform X2 [Tubulanus polymorphus]|uniref:cysteine-rich protein 2-binding protein-like isoform X2 n=1 Tax=Tubulanus polymorphus TaxID=672921 RepID=UPI003DA65342